MRFLKFMLYTILFFCLTWGSFIIFGPSFIQRAVIYFSDGEVTPERVIVHPNLDIHLPVVRVQVLNSSPINRVSATVRSVDISWSFRNFEPEVLISLGPTEVNNLVNFKQANIRIFSNQAWSLSQHLHFEAKFQTADFASRISAQNLSFAGKLRENFHQIENILFTFDEVNFSNFVLQRVGRLEGELSQFDFKLPIHMQTNSVVANYMDLKSVGRVIELKNIQHSINNTGGNLDSELVINDFELDEPNIKFGSLDLNVSFYFDGVNGLKVLKPWFVSARKLEAFSEVTVRRLKAEFLLNANKDFPNSLSGSIEGLTMVSNGIHLFDLGQSSFFGSIEANPLNHNLGAHFKLSAKTDPTFDISVNSENLLTRKILKMNCFELKCLEENFELSYVANIGAAAIVGNIFCEYSDCAENSFLLNAKTSNTSSFFENLANTKIFNPIYLALLFRVFLVGTPNGQGHEIDLNFSI